MPVREALTQAYEAVNAELTGSKTVNAGLSGTTAVSLMVEDGKLIVANTGQ